MSDAAKWDTRYRDASVGDGEPVQVLRDYAHLLPGHGRALDLACGLGANALLLAARGLDTLAWDLSAVAVDKLNAYARAHDLPLHAEVRDLTQHGLPEHHFDVIAVSRYLERRLCPAIQAALKPGGLLYYQTWTRTQVGEHGPGNPAFRLARNELLHLFSALDVIAYREEDTVGDTARGLRDEAYLVAQRPA
ncbi:methyltransferase domain-containing protein [Sulfurivermis fontis]|uniref:methyltransferase domain-containing protein n=1 Tax=Sulfurivermis fontis TaxID=1972068 RepID=UPI000FDBB40B|nr:methyltransferase domain-containing protein [Sulfurivermis fontis]